MVNSNQFSNDGRLHQPLDRELISDALRRQLGVPTVVEQQAQIEKLVGK
jgi:hypothetical protein